MTTLILILIYIALLWKMWIDYKYIKSLEELAGRLETELAYERTNRNNERAAEVRNRMKEMEEEFKIRQQRTDERRDKWKVKGE